ncbi:hypothetical protein BDU57DRAFT_454511 [Ampelomyces quisqualis]|uniref:RING-type domain-containing protein n=1 Tax=Ampelomyces quisqualis TaxID=50730 RepID=A0A6A5QH35_AMPQU|nr:hypothetical protein BDU57DRAFT_454511 [Ampelomyces quisqualis]
MASKADADSAPKGGTIVAAIVVPSVFVIVIIILIVTRAFVLLRINGGGDDFSLVKEERTKQRLEEIESIIRPRSFYDWSRERSRQQSKPSFPSDPLCSICLDDFVEAAQIRGLRCSHVFHTHCLDEWFARFNDYCPLCHRAIIPGKSLPTRRPNFGSDPIPVADIV